LKCGAALRAHDVTDLLYSPKICNHVGAFSQRIELERILTDHEVHNLALKPGEVREYGPKAL